MTQRSLFISVFSILILVVIGSGSLFTVDERQKAFVLQFGELKHVYDTPGLKFKIPLIQEVLFYDFRLLDYNLPAVEVTAGDQKRMVIDVIALYSISNPVDVYKTVRNITGINNRLSTIVPGSMRRVVGQIPLSKLLSKDRSQVMDSIHKEVREAAKGFGIDVKDVRIIRADLPKENSEAIFRRMESEREQEAKLFRAEGRKRGNEIRSRADRKRREIIAEAKKKAEIIRGEGDAKATQTYAQAFGQDEKFFNFYQSMQAYKVALGDEGKTTFILSKDNEFFKHF